MQIYNFFSRLSEYPMKFIVQGHREEGRPPAFLSDELHNPGFLKIFIKIYLDL